MFIWLHLALQLGLASSLMLHWLYLSGFRLYGLDQSSEKIFPSSVPADYAYVVLSSVMVASLSSFYLISFSIITPLVFARNITEIN